MSDIVSYHFCSQHLRQVGVVGKFVEFFGPGVAQLSIADRATIANMCPEYGATAAFFAVDDVSVQYLEQTGEWPAAVSFFNLLILNHKNVAYVSI